MSLAPKERVFYIKVLDLAWDYAKSSNCINAEFKRIWHKLRRYFVAGKGSLPTKEFMRVAVDNAASCMPDEGPMGCLEHIVHNCHSPNRRNMRSLADYRAAYATIWNLIRELEDG